MSTGSDEGVHIFEQSLCGLLFLAASEKDADKEEQDMVLNDAFGYHVFLNGMNSSPDGQDRLMVAPIAMFLLRPSQGHFRGLNHECPMKRGRRGAVALIPKSGKQM